EAAESRPRPVHSAPTPAGQKRKPACPVEGTDTSGVSWVGSKHDKTTMEDWIGYRDEILGRIGELAKLSPDTVRGYQTLSGAGAKTGHLDGKTRELIALAVAATTRCDGCITVHSK